MHNLLLAMFAHVLLVDHLMEIQSPYSCEDYCPQSGYRVTGRCVIFSDSYIFFCRMNMHNALLAMFAHDLYVDLVETQSPCNRKDYCLKVASGLLEDVSSALYLSTFTREQLNAMTLELQTLFTQLKIILQEQFKEAEWLDDFSRSYLTSKLQQLIPIADGGVAFLDNSYLLNEQLSEVNISSGSYLENSVQLVRRYRSSMYSLLNTEPNVTNTM